MAAQGSDGGLWSPAPGLSSGFRTPGQDGAGLGEPGAGWGARPGRGAQVGGDQESRIEEAWAWQPAGWELPLVLRPIPWAFPRVGETLAQVLG